MTPKCYNFLAEVHWILGRVIYRNFL